jgi:hypothetical protein
MKHSAMKIFQGSLALLFVAYNLFLDFDFDNLDL